MCGSGLEEAAVSGHILLNSSVQDALKDSEDTGERGGTFSSEVTPVCLEMMGLVADSLKNSGKNVRSYLKVVHFKSQNLSENLGDEMLSL